MELADLFAPPALRVLLLVVLFAPLVFAVLMAAVGDRYRLVRRLAGLLAALHLALTVFLVAPAVIAINEYATHKLPEKRALRFRPVAVPGDTGAALKIAGGGGEEHSTSWNLFAVGKPNPEGTPSVQFFVGLDGLNVWLVVLTSLMTYVAVAMSWRTTEKAGGYYAWVFVLQTAVTGAFVSFDVLLYYVFFELTLIPTFFLIGGWGVGGGKRDAARKFFLYTLFGSLFSLVGLIGIVYTNPAAPEPKTVDKVGDEVPSGGPVSFSVNQLMENVSDRLDRHNERVKKVTEEAAKRAEELQEKQRQKANDLTPFQKAADEAQKVAEAATADRDRHKATQAWLFFALIAGFVVKVPLVPFHTWLPAAYGEAPPAVTMLLSALLAKLGTLGMLRVVIPLCPDMAVQYGLPVFGTLGAISIVYAALCAFAQKDIKLMAAYSSVSHLGLLVLGMFALTAEGLTGATLHMVNHGLSAGAMFALLGFLHDRYRTTDMTQLGGLWSKYPKYTFFVVVICLASVGLPGLNNFVSEMLLIGGLFHQPAVGPMNYGLAVAAAAGILLSAWYTFTMLTRVFFGPLKEPAVPDGAAPARDISGREGWAFFLPAAACLVLGVYPQPVIDTMKGDVGVIERHTQKAHDRLTNKQPDAPKVFGPGGGPGGPPPGGPAGGGPPGGGRPPGGPPGGGRPPGGPPGPPR